MHKPVFGLFGESTCHPGCFGLLNSESHHRQSPLSRRLHPETHSSLRVGYHSCTKGLTHGIRYCGSYIIDSRISSH